MIDYGLGLVGEESTVGLKISALRAGSAGTLGLARI